MSTRTNIVVTRWWLIRHAPVVNPDGLIYGQDDPPADLGDHDALAALAAALPREAVWVTTPFQRTGQTAEALGAIDPLVEPDLAEQHFGSWQGLSHDAVSARFPDEACRFWAAPATERPPGGESFREVTERTAAALTRLTAARAGHRHIAVIHGGSIRAALALALDLTPEAALRIAVEPLSLTRLDHIATGDGAGVWRVVTVNAHSPGTFMTGTG
jgi:alpha-ribazole phosphatase